MRTILLTTAMGVSALLAGAASGAGVDWLRSDPIATADSLYLIELDPQAALDVLRGVISEDEGSGATPRLYESSWRAARAALTLGVLAGPERGVREQWYRLAEEYGRQAAELYPDRPDGRYWMVAAQGRRALQSGGIEAASLAKAVRLGSHEILERHPSHAGAHNALGRLFLEVLKLTRMERMLGRVFAGDVISEATWEASESHLTQAVDLDPGMVLYRVDLGRFYLARESWAEATAVLQAARALPIVYPADSLFQREAQQLMDRIR